VLTKSFWIGGFECSCHCRRDGRRLDLTAATLHDRFAVADYRRLVRAGISTAREGVRWHLIERSPGRYDMSSLLPLVRAARDSGGQGVQVIWDLCHYGWPEDLDPFKPDFVDRFADYARAVARLISQETDEPPVWVPINEISFLSWAGGDVAYLNPFATGRGFELKAQLVRASLTAVDALWDVDPRARILYADPAIHIVADPGCPEDVPEAEANRLAQYQAWEMLAGQLWPQLGGDARYLDLLGINYYPNNQWILDGDRIPQDHPLYRPFRDILLEVWQRFGRPLLISETGAEGDARAPWLCYVAEEVRAARHAGVPVEGICLYPIVDYPGWDDDRHCPSGLWGFPDACGERPVHLPLALELERQTELLRRESLSFPADPPELKLVVEEEIEHAVF